MDANKLKTKILEKGLDVDVAIEVCERLSSNESITIGDAIKLKNLLNLTNPEAIEIFL